MRRFFLGWARVFPKSDKNFGSGWVREDLPQGSLYPFGMWVIGWVRERLFSQAVAELRGAWGRLIRFLRVLWFAAREFRLDYCAERAATLSFATIISLIPLAVLFASFAVQVGYGDKFIEYVKGTLFPLIAPDFQEELMNLLEDINKTVFQEGLGGIVGIIALVGLIMSAIGVLNTAERNFNRIWKVQGSRTYLQKLTIFWVVLTTSPFILVASAWVGDHVLAPRGGIIEELKAKYIALRAVYGFLVPVTIGFIGFTVLYKVLPSTKVRLRSAMVGGMIAAVLWELSRRGFWLYIGRSPTVYGSLWIVPLFLVWVYINWFITLWGCEISYAHQNLEHLTELLTKPKISRQLPAPFIAVYYVGRLTGAFLKGEKPSDVTCVAEEIGVTTQEIEEAARKLVENEILIEDGRRPGVFGLAVAPERIRLDELVKLFAAPEIAPETLPALPRAAGEEGEGASREDHILEAFQRAREAYLAAFAEKTLRDVVPDSSLPCSESPVSPPH